MRTPERRRNRHPRTRARLFRAMIVATALLGPLAAHSDDEPEAASAGAPAAESGSIGWEPAITLGFGLHSQNLDGTFETDMLAAAGNELELGRGGTNDLLGQHFTPGVALDAPPFYEEGLQPRLFVHAGYQYPTSDEHIARRYLKSFANPVVDPEVATSCAGPTAARCVVRPKNRLILEGGWYAGLGVDIRLPITVLERQNFHLRTSFDYYGQEWHGRTVIDRFSIVNPPGNPGTVQNDIIKSRSDEKVVHGLGPRIQLALRLAERGPLRFDAYLGAQFYWLLSSNRITYTGSNEAGENSRATTQAKPFLVQGGFGIRVVWTGEKEY